MASSATRYHVSLRTLWRTCETHKVTYTTRDEALQGAERGMDAGLVEVGCHLTPYACDRCGHWHIRNRQIV